MANLKPGSKAPELGIADQNGNIVNISEYSGKKLVVYFYPKDNTPGCTAEACSLRDGFEGLKAKNIEILGISADSSKSHQLFAQKHQLPFRLLSDADKKVLKAWEAWGEKKMYGKTYEGIIRKTYIIDEKGIIAHIIEKVDTKNHAAQIIEVINS